ncbi:MAG: DUF523 domain-containing protein [Firmicutes bacterium]|nr:DUF523 domain-containing protein [Bacillota bacterium]
MAHRFLVSACLAGHSCAYDGRARPHPLVERLVGEGRAVPVCPEALGGLPTPRPPAEIQGGDGHEVFAGRARVVDLEGRDVTDAFLEGARTALAIARRHGLTAAILKARSPSCGYGLIYDGTFAGRLRPGHGVTAALLLHHGFPVFTESEAERAVTS